MLEQWQDEVDMLKNLKQSWDYLDTKYIEEYLDDDVIYESQWVFSSLKGKDKVIEYLNGKFDTIKKSEKEKKISMLSLIGYVYSMSYKPCIILSQIIEDEIVQATVLIEIRNNKITRIDVCFVPSTDEVLINYKISHKRKEC